MASTTFHLSIDIRSAIKQSNYVLNGMFSNKDGTQMCGDDVRNKLLQYLSEGKERLPSAECEGFDYKTGCPGHPTTNKERK